MDWQPIETAPKDGTAILLYWPRYSGETTSHIAIGAFKTNYRIERASVAERGKMMPSYFSDSSELDDYDMAVPENAPSHWMPLPQPPQ